jgi:hypothetical protein
LPSVLDVVRHSFGWSGLGVEQTAAAFGRPGDQHETGGQTKCRRHTQNRSLGGQVLPRRDQKGTECGDATKDQRQSNDQDRVPTGTGPLTRHACGLPTSRGGESCQLAGFVSASEVLFIRVGGTGHVMSSETIVAASGLIGLGAVVVTGAIWDVPLVAPSLRLVDNLRSQGRHAVPR